jgi:hypothetical protein
MFLVRRPVRFRHSIAQRDSGHSFQSSPELQGVLEKMPAQFPESRMN